MILLGLVVSLLFAAEINCTNGELQQNERNLEFDNAVMWKKLFLKLDIMASEIEKLSQGQTVLNERLDELSQRLAQNEIPSFKSAVAQIPGDSCKWKDGLVESVQGLRDDFNGRQTELIEVVNKRQTELIEVVNKRQDIQENILRQSFSFPKEWRTILRNTFGRGNKSWNEYKKGFSDYYTDFIGLDQLHVLTTYESAQELLITLEDWNGEKRYAKYDLFQIGSAAEKYPLKVLGAYSGDAGDSLRSHLGHKFSTLDQDNDDNDQINCASVYGGGWWFYGNCTMSLLTGPYRYEKDAQTTWGISWSSWKGWYYSLKSVEMGIRPTLSTHLGTNF